MKRKYYLIDTENVGDRWIELIGSLKEEEILVVFYTKNHSKLLEENYLKQRYNKQIRWVECLVGTNALDHQLMGVLSYLIATHGEAGYVIFSNDTDYQNVIDFWQQRNVDLSLVNFPDGRKKEKKEEAKEPQCHLKESLPQPPAAVSPVANSAVVHSASVAANSQAFHGSAHPEAGGTGALAVPDMGRMTDTEKVMEIARTVPTSQMSGWYAVLVIFLGQETGRKYYLQIRGDEERKARLSKYLLPDPHTRNLYLIQLLHQQNHLDVSRAQESYEIVMAHNRKNKKAIKADFEKHFGKKTGEGARYFRVVKPVIDVLKGK